MRKLQSRRLGRNTGECHASRWSRRRQKTLRIHSRGLRNARIPFDRNVFRIRQSAQFRREEIFADPECPPEAARAEMYVDAVVIGRSRFVVYSVSIAELKTAH